MAHVMQRIQAITPTNNEVARTCVHCHHPIPRELDGDYCCHGCASAYRLIHDLELDRYYELMQSSEDSPGPLQLQNKDYRLFDQKEFQQDFVEKQNAEQQAAHFYLENMSCYACVWLCESVARKLDPKASLSINMSDGSAVLTFASGQVPLSQYFQVFEKLGYPVHPDRDYQQDSKKEIARIGVALFCVMNVMLLAFPEYLGQASLEQAFRQLFRWLAAGLTGLSIFYAGWPFLSGSWQALKARELHLDLPIGLALLVSYGYSLVRTWQDHPHVYFDSATAVVALLLVGRWVQKQALRNIAKHEARFLEGEAKFVRKLLAEGQEQMELLPLVQKGDLLKILPGELVPVDAELVSEQTSLDYSLLTGESVPSACQKGEMISAGAVNGPSPILVKSVQLGHESLLLRLQKASQALHQHKGQYLGLSEKFARAFVLFVLVMAFFALFFNLSQSLDIAMTRFATVLLIACPCIFGFGAPLVMARALLLGLQKGVLFRSQKALERLGLAQDYYFDKTGTLTEESSFVASGTWHEDNLRDLGLNLEQAKALLQALAKVSQHHVLAALARWGEQSEPGAVTLSKVQEHYGQGLSCLFGHHELRVGRAHFCLPDRQWSREEAAYSYLTLDGKLCLTVQLDESLREEAKNVLASLRSQSAQVFILSGDSEARAQALGARLGLHEKASLGALSPEMKNEKLRKRDLSVMVGNGINDSLAISGVEIGVALANATEALKERADISLTKPGLYPLLDAIALSKATARAMRRTFGFALFFNLIGMSLALSGLATPVLAAILMPISSLTIFAIAQRWQA